VTDSGELFTLEPSHGKPRLTAPRPSDLGTVPTGEEPSRDRGAGGLFKLGNQAAVNRSAKQALRRPYRDAEKRVGEALASRLEPSEADALLTDALAVYRSASRELGNGSAFVHGGVIAFATETVLAGFYMRAAADAGFLTERGMLLHDRALASEQAAARAMTAALAACKALSGKRKPRRARPSYLEAEGTEAKP
jgi:hypothetical protein